MCSSKVHVQTLKVLEPIASLSEARLDELASLCQTESVSRNSDPFRLRGIAGQAVYLVHGELALAYPDNFSRVLVGGSGEARYPLGRSGEMFVSAKAITDVELVRIDNELVDMMMTWEQVANSAPAEAQSTAEEPPRSLANWSILSGMFSVSNLKYGTFAQLPSPHIEELLRRFERDEKVDLRRGVEADAAARQVGAGELDAGSLGPGIGPEALERHFCGPDFGIMLGALELLARPPQVIVSDLADENEQEAFFRIRRLRERSRRNLSWCWRMSRRAIWIRPTRNDCTSCSRPSPASMAARSWW